MPSHGKDVYLSLEDSAASTLRNISPYITSSTFNQSNDTHDVTTYGDEAHEYVGGLTNGTINITGLYDITASVGSATVLDSLVGLDGVTVGFEYGPNGNANGAVKYSGECILQDLAYSAPVADLVTFTCTLQISGAVTKGTFS